MQVQAKQLRFMPANNITTVSALSTSDSAPDTGAL